MLLAEHVYSVRLCISRMREHFGGTRGEMISATGSRNTAAVKCEMLEVCGLKPPCKILGKVVKYFCSFSYLKQNCWSTNRLNYGFFFFCALACDGLKTNVRWFISIFNCFRCFKPLVTWEIPQVSVGTVVSEFWLHGFAGTGRKNCYFEHNPVLLVPPHSEGSTWKHLTAQPLYLMWRKLLTKTVTCRCCWVGSFF